MPELRKHFQLRCGIWSQSRTLKNGMCDAQRVYGNGSICVEHWTSLCYASYRGRFNFINRSSANQLFSFVSVYACESVWVWRVLSSSETVSSNFAMNFLDSFFAPFFKWYPTLDWIFFYDIFSVFQNDETNLKWFLFIW